ncbi:MAG: ABC transporter substrate-binding protein [Alphaproteobacteria bacterium]
MLTRRKFLLNSTQTLTGLAGLYALPSLANAKLSYTLWGAPVGVSTLLAATQYTDLATKYNIDTKLWKGPDQLRVGVVNGTMPLCMVPSYVAANFYNQGQAVRFMNIMTWGLLYIVSKDGNVQSLEDLKGKKLVMPFKNDMPDLVLQTLCKKANISLQNDADVTYTAVPPEAAGLLLNGQADCALLPEPAASMAVIRGKAEGLTMQAALSLQDVWGALIGPNARIPQAGLMVTQEFYDNNAAFIADLNTALPQALDWVNKNPTDAAQLGSKLLSIPAPILAHSLPLSNLTITPTLDAKDEILGFYQSLFELNPKIVGGKMPDAGLFI